MFKKLVTALPLILALLISPLVLSGCSKKNVADTTYGLYVFDQVDIKVNGETKLLRDTLTPEEVASHSESEMVWLEDLKAADLYDMKIILYFVVEEIGAFLNKDGTFDFNMEDYTAPTEDDNAPDLSKYENLIEGATWFKNGKNVYVNGLFTFKMSETGAERVFDNSVCLCFNIVGKDLQINFTYNDEYDETTSEYGHSEEYLFTLHKVNM